jgi:UDP-N-acetylglucosamine:LPS N-acetylglucosamine transferase
MKIALVGSSGGHLSHLLRLAPWWGAHDRFWVTFELPDATGALTGERVYWCHHPTNRNLPNLLRNASLARRVVAAERPDLIVSSGAAVALPFFAWGRAFGARTAFLEVVDRIEHPTLTGRLVRPWCDLYLVQWPEQQAWYPRARLVGPLFP